MVDVPGRAGFEPDHRADDAEDGWGSPLPAEYGSLRAVRPDPAPVEPPAAARPAPPVEARPRRPTPLLRREGGRITSLLRRIEGGSDHPSPAAPLPRPAAPGLSPAAAVPRPAAPGPSPAAGVPRPAAPGPSPAAAGPAAGVPIPAAAGPAEATTGAPAETPAAAGAPAAPVAAPPDPAVVESAGVVPVDAAGRRPNWPVPPGGLPLGARSRPGRRPGRVRTRATVRHIDVWTVARVSLLFYLVVLLALVTASVLLWVFADAFGALPSIEKSVRSLFSLKSFTLHPTTVGTYTAAFGLVLCIAGTFANVLGALMYNLIADVVGGVRVELESFSRE